MDRQVRRALAAVVALLSALVLTLVPVGAAGAAPPGEDPFYTPPSPLPAGSPGDLLRSRSARFTLDPVLKLPAPGVRSWQMLYRSTTARDEPIAVSGTVLVPSVPWFGPGKRPVVSWGVGTRGLGDDCAPSYTLSQGTDYEAAFIAASRAPGLTRRFAMESWPAVTYEFEKFEAVRREAREKFEEGLKRPIRIAGSDISPEAIELAKRHLKQAGLAGRIELQVKDLRDVTLAGEPGVFIANPPYGERLDSARAAHAIARQLGLLQRRNPGWTLCAFSADMGFEREYGRRATRRRRYYNGRIECEYRIFEEVRGAKA